MADEEHAPNMGEILESMRRIQFGHMLDEIEANAGRVRAIVAQGSSESWDHEAIRKCAHSISFYSEALEDTLTTIGNGSPEASPVATPCSRGNVS